MGILLYKSTLPHSSRYSRRQRIDEVHISILIALDQHASNYLEEAVRSLTAMRSRCRSSRANVSLHRYSQFSSCSVLVGSLLLSDISLHHCGSILLHTNCYCAIGKSSFSKANIPLLFKLRELLEFLLIRSWRHT